MWWWLSTERMTICVRTDSGGKVEIAPPIARVFIGQPVNNLIRWLKKQPGFKGQILQ